MTDEEVKLKKKLSQSERQLERALALFTISSEMHKTLNLDEVYKIILDTLKQIIGIESASILLRDDKTNKFASVAPMDRKTGYKAQIKKKYPLKLENKTIGEIHIHSLLLQKKRLTEDDAELLTILADQAAVAITGAKLYTCSSESLANLRGKLDRTFKNGKLIVESELTPKIEESLESRYYQLLKSYLKTMDLDKEDSAVLELCQELIKYDISPKGIISIHLETIPKISTVNERETLRIAFEVRMVLLKVMTTYANILRQNMLAGGGGGEFNTGN